MHLPMHLELSFGHELCPPDDVLLGVIMPLRLGDDVWGLRHGGRAKFGHVVVLRHAGNAVRWAVEEWKGR